MIIPMTDKSHHKNGKASSKTTKPSNEQTSFDIPTFRLPKDFETDPDRYELWTLRLPTDVPFDALEGVKINIQKEASVEFESNDKRYQISWGDSVENESFRLLASSQNGNDDDSDDDDSEKSNGKKATFIYPITRSFSRHLNIMESLEKMDERTLAPTQEEAPRAVDPLRIPYVPVAQRTNLRRRWQMPGSKMKKETTMVKEGSPPSPVAKRKVSGADSISVVAANGEEDEEERKDSKPPAKRKLSETSITEGSGEVVGDKEAKKAAKRAKKEAKAAKKEAKKEKKEKKSEKKNMDKR